MEWEAEKAIERKEKMIKYLAEKKKDKFLII
jgi:hypothetical protein